MPGSTLPNTGVVLPSVGGDVGTWGNEVNDALSNYDAHDHKPGAGSRITTAAINIDADLSFSSLYGASNLQRAQFSATALPANNLSMFVSNGTGGLSAGELYWRNNTGTPIRFTSGNALNFASFVGGIGGDYASVGALEAFDDSQKQYTFKDGTSPAKWARLHAGNLRFAPFGTTSSFFAEMAAPSGLASNYTMTLPLSLPTSAVGNTAVAQISNSGVMTFSDAIAASTIAASGLITANAGVTAAANQKIRVSGTGSFPHGTFTLQIPISMSIPKSSGVQYLPDVSGLIFGAASNGDYLLIPVPLTAGKRILAVRVFIRGVAAGATLEAHLTSLGSAGGAALIAVSNLSTATATNQVLLISGLTTVVTAGTAFTITVTSISPGQNNVLWGAQVDYDEP